MVAGYGYDNDGKLGRKLKIDIAVSQVCPRSETCVLGKGYCEVGDVRVAGCHPDDVMFDGRCRFEVDYIERVVLPCGSLYYEQSDGGPCQGDSGGPMLTEIGGVEYLFGVTSYGDAVCHVYGISTAVSDYRDWIEQTAPEILDGFDENCDNGIEDDGNGQSDCYDTLCMSEKTCTPDTNEGSVSYPEQEDAPVKEHSTSGCSVSGLSAGGLGIWALMAGGIAVLRGRKKEFKV